MKISIMLQTTYKKVLCAFIIHSLSAGPCAGLSLPVPAHRQVRRLEGHTWFSDGCCNQSQVPWGCGALWKGKPCAMMAQEWGEVGVGGRTVFLSLWSFRTLTARC